MAAPQRRAGGNTRGRYRVGTPGHILDVAARLFAERGYAAVSLKDIVQAAGVNGAAVNYHFGDKRNLYRALIERGLVEREQAAPLGGALDRSLAPERRLRSFIESLMTQLLGDSMPSMMSRLMLREAIEPTEAFARAVDELPRRQLRILDDIISGLARPGTPAVAVRRMSISVLGQCVYYRYGEKFLRRIDPKLRYSPRAVKAIARHIHAFSVAGIRGMALEG